MWAAVDERFIEESHFQLRERAVLSVLDFYLKHFDEVAVKFFFLSIQDEYFGCYQISKCPS